MWGLRIRIGGFRLLMHDARILMAKARKSNRFDGCTFTLFVGFVIIGLFIANGIFVRAFFAPQLDLVDNRIYKPIQFALPIIMIFLEYWIYDKITGLFRKSSGRG